MKTFIQTDLQPLIREPHKSGSRVYRTESGAVYPSVTTVLSLHSEKSIQAWKDAVGLDEANLTSKRAAERGTRVHTFCEEYLLGKNPKADMFDAPMMYSLKPMLDNIDNIYCLESQLYSEHLAVAGTVDCIAEYNGKLCIIDFKTSSRVKRKDEIDSYFMQMAAYAVMFEERTGKPISNLKVIMGVDFDKPILFDEKRDNWIDRFIAIRRQFKQLKGY